MEVVSLSAERAEVVRWRDADGGWQATVVCKVSYGLRSGVLSLAEHQVPIHREPQHHDDGSLWAPSDLAPYKQRCDVVLVGHAFAPRGRATPQLTARLSLSHVDKSVRVLGARLIDPRGHRLPPAAFRRIALRHHQAPRGAANENPVGVPAGGAPTPDGARLLPNLTWPDERDEPFACFAPIAAGWPTRRVHGGAAELGWLEGLVRETPMPADVDDAFFQCAPPDQQIPFLRGDEPLSLTHLHPEQPQLECALPGRRIVAYAKARDVDPQEVPMVCDTIWIDTDDQLCALTWRGRLKLHRDPDDYRVFTVLAGPGEEPGYEELHRRAREQDGPPSDPNNETRRRREPNIKSETNLLMAVVPHAALPFEPSEGRASRPSGPPPPEPPPPEPFPGAPWSRPSDSRAGAPSSAFDGAPHHPLDTTAPHPALPARESAYPPPSDFPRASTRDSVYPSSSNGNGSPHPPEAQAAGFSDTARLPKAPPPAVLPKPSSLSKPGAWSGSAQARPVRPAVVSRQPGTGSAAGGVLAAMDAARAPADNTPARTPSPPAAPHKRARPALRHKLLWFDPRRVGDVRAEPGFADLLSDRELRLIEEGRDEELEGTARDRADVFELLVRGADVPLRELSTRVDAATDEHGMFEPPVLVVAGELSFPFDPVARLRATVTVLTPLSLGDKPLRGLIDEAEEMLRSPWLEGSHEVADQLVVRLKGDATRAKRGLGAEVIDKRTEQLLLEQRAYQERKLYGATWLRALIADNNEPPQLCYLPAALRDILPLYARFEARLLVELDLREEQGESCPLALKALALARTLR